MTFPREVYELRHAYLPPLMICKCITWVTSERFPMAYEKNRSGINKMATSSVVLTIVRFYSRKTSEIYPGACPVTDRRFNVCYIRYNMHFGLEKQIKKKTVYFIEQWGS